MAAATRQKNDTCWPVMGTTTDYCKYIKALLTPDYGGITIMGIDLSHM